MARARTLASQLGGDANQSVIIDSLGGARAALNDTIRTLCRKYSADQKFIRDTVTRNTVTITAGTGACPDTVMREFLHTGQFQDDNDSLITYYNYNVDFASDQNFNQLGYVVLQGDTFHYTAPAPDLDTYNGNLFVTAPTFPTFPASMATAITFPSVTFIDDLCSLLTEVLVGKVATV